MIIYQYHTGLHQLLRNKLNIDILQARNLTSISMFLHIWINLEISLLVCMCRHVCVGLL